MNETTRILGGIDVLILNHAFGRIQNILEIPDNEIEQSFEDSYFSTVRGNVSLIKFAMPWLSRNKGHVLFVCMYT